MQDFQFDYDQSGDDLFIFRKNSKTHGSVEIGPVVLDFDSTGELAGIEILGAVPFLASSTHMPEKAVEGILGNLAECRVSRKLWRNSILMITVSFSSKSREELLWNLSVPQIGKEARICSPPASA